MRIIYLIFRGLHLQCISNNLTRVCASKKRGDYVINSVEILKVSIFGRGTGICQ